MTEEAKDKIRQSRIGKKFSEEAKFKMRLAKLGKPSPRKGKTHTEETKRLISQKLTGKNNPNWGKRLSAELRRKLSEAHLKIRESNHFWKGGITAINKILSKNVEWKLWREAVFQRDNWTCQKCKRKGGKLHPHHIKPKSQFPELRYAIDNGQTLCSECHKKTPSYGNPKKLRININELANNISP